ncbi:phage tail protein [Pseudomonas sp. NY11955]|uniref:phage tail protein n=1 Tax=Pseudomonas sp. NY11955 TaxID=3400363 RepID=UPI003A89AA86
MARQPFNTRWAQGVESEDSLNSFKDPGVLRLGTGWEGGQDKDAPPAGHENWWHNRVDSALQGVERNGVMDWHEKAQYGLGAPTYGSDGNFYESLSAGNTGNDPVLTTGFWRYAGTTFFNGHQPGDVKIVAHNGIPAPGWLKCNGPLLLRASYPRLFALIGTTYNTGGENSLQFRGPDYRGEFLRGFDDGRGVDTERSFGSYQVDALQNIVGQINSRPFLATDIAGAIASSTGAFSSTIQSGAGGATPITADSGSTRQLDTTTFDASRSARTSTETRPRNRSVNYWIKY